MRKIQILATSDVHAYIMNDDYKGTGNKDLGMASVSSLVKEMRDENTLLIDNGDLIQGSPLSMYLHKYYPERILPLVKILNKMKFDYLNLGNHDFNNGKKRLLELTDNTDAKFITNNVIIDDKELSAPYHIHEFENGMKIALFGIVTDYVNIFEKEDNLVGIQVTDTFENARNAVELIKSNEKVDYVVGVYHGGFEKDLDTLQPLEKLTGENVGVKMLEEIDGIDVLITGHQHRSIARKFNGVIVTQTNFEGKELAKIDLYEDASNNSCELVKVNNNPDPEIMEIIEDAERGLQEYLDKDLIEVDYDLKIKDEFAARLNKHPLVSFVNQIQLGFTGADLSGVALFNGVPGYNKKVKVRDILINYPYSNTLKLVKINGKNLKKYLEANARYFDVKDDEIVISDAYLYPKVIHYNYDMVDGMEYTIKASNEVNNRIVEMKYQGKDIKEDDEFTLATSDYRYTGVGGFDMIAECELVNAFEIDMTEVIIDYLEKNDKLIIDHKDNIKLIK